MKWCSLSATISSAVAGAAEGRAPSPGRPDRMPAHFGVIDRADPVVIVGVDGTGPGVSSGWK